MKEKILTSCWINVLIPSYTIRFSRSSRHRPFGIAYAEFSSVEQASKVVKDLNGALFKDRQIFVKLHVPFSPTGKPIFGRRKTSSGAEKLGDASNKVNLSAKTDKPLSSDTKDFDGVASTVPRSINIEDIPFTDEPKKVQDEDVQKKLSNDTIFIGNAVDKTVDKDVREFFNDYYPTQVFIFRGANQKRMQRTISLRQKTVSVLVTLKKEEDLSKAISELNSKKLNGRAVYLKAAHLSKIEEVVNAAKITAVPSKSPPTTATADDEAQEQKGNTTAETSTLLEMFKDTQKKIQGKYKETIEKQIRPSDTPLGEEEEEEEGDETKQGVPNEEMIVA